MAEGSSIITLGFVVLVAVAMFLGAFTTMTGFNQAGYNVTALSNGTAMEIMDNMEATSTDLKDSLTGEQSWLQTTFNIFFTMPNNVMSTLATVSNSAGKMISIGAGDDNPIPTPSWVMPIVYISIALMVVGALIYLALGRRG